jgi:hypothetical protein
VVEDLERKITDEVAAAFEGAPDPVAGMAAALDVFLTACLRPEVRRISLTDAPAVLGWTTWREIEAEHGLGLLTAILSKAIEDGLLTPLPVRALAQLSLAAVMEAAHHGRGGRGPRHGTDGGPAGAGHVVRLPGTPVGRHA